MISGLSTNEMHITWTDLEFEQIIFWYELTGKRNLSIITNPKMERKMLSVCLLPATSSGIDSTNFSPPFKRVDTARSAKSMLLLMLMEKLKNTDGIPSALITFALFSQINFDYFASE